MDETTGMSQCFRPRSARRMLRDARKVIANCNLQSAIFFRAVAASVLLLTLPGCLGARGDEIKGRRLSDVDASLVRALEFECQIERLLLHVDQRECRYVGPVGALGVGAGRDARLAQPGVRDLAVAAADIEIRSGEVDLEVTQQRL